VAISLRELTRSIGKLAELDTAEDAEVALREAVEAARVLLDADTAGLLLANADGELGWAVAADPRARSATDAQQRRSVGPSVTAFEDGRPVVVADVTADGRWAPVQRELAEAGIRGCLSVPVTLAGGPVGVLDLYSTEPRVWDDSHIATAQTYAGVLSLLLGAVLTATAAGELAEQLQHALTSRIKIEQAKGVLMAEQHLSERAAWEWLRRSARTTRRQVSAVAEEILAEVVESAAQDTVRDTEQDTEPQRAANPQAAETGEHPR
jgi:GAF domain-containing protein